MLQPDSDTMTAGSDTAWYVGCSCDRAFVQHTAVMLTSLALNGEAPEAVILIAGFGLTAADRRLLRAAAGPFGGDVRFLDVTPAMLGELAARDWESHYSLPIFGRLLLPNLIAEPGARLITFDSDMIINRSVRPLFELDLLGEYVAAVHDAPRERDADYFNSGLMVIEVDGYRKYDIGRRCLDWLSGQDRRPEWPDQDALNAIVGHKWYRLDRTWNRAYSGSVDRAPLTADFYENARVAHFAGQRKPWNSYDHPGRPLYEHYLAQMQARHRTYDAVADHADTGFVFTAFELLLGREPVSFAECAPFLKAGASAAIHSLMRSAEFARHTLLSLRLGVDFPSGRFERSPTARHWRFIVERLPVSQSTADETERCSSWRGLLLLLLSDGEFRSVYALDPLLSLADVAAARLTEGRSVVGAAGIEPATPAV